MIDAVQCGIGCLHELFEAQADARPFSPAVSCGDREWTYEEIDDWANRLARHLRSIGVRVPRAH